MFEDFTSRKFFSAKLGKGKRVSITLHLVAISERLLYAKRGRSHPASKIVASLPERKGDASQSCVCFPLWAFALLCAEYSYGLEEHPVINLLYLTRSRIEHHSTTYIYHFSFCERTESGWMPLYIALARMLYPEIAALFIDNLIDDTSIFKLGSGPHFSRIKSESITWA